MKNCLNRSGSNLIMTIAALRRIDFATDLFLSLFVKIVSNIARKCNEMARLNKALYFFD